MPSQEKPPKSKEKDQKEEKTSFFKGLKSSLSLKLQNEGGEDQNSSTEGTEVSKDDVTEEVKSNISDSPDKTEKEEPTPQDTEEDLTQYFIDKFKSHKIFQSLINRRIGILKAIAIVISIILISIAIFLSIGTTDRVASNVIFGERAMFSAFLVLVAFLLLAAVFARRLLEGKYFKDIHHELEIVEGEEQEDNGEDPDHDPAMERINKKDK